MRLRRGELAVAGSDGSATGAGPGPQEALRPGPDLGGLSARARLPYAIRTIFLVLGLSWVWYAGGPPAAGQMLPHRTYALQGYSTSDRYQMALASVRDRLIAALQASPAMPPGYPQPCRFTFDPPPQPGVISRVTPVASVRTDPAANGILLDAEGHFLMLAVVDFPDTRLHLIEIFLVPDLTGAVLPQADRDTLPRVVIGFPALGESQLPALVDTLRRGLRDAGAYEISFK